MIEIRKMAEKDLAGVLEIETENFTLPWSAEGFRDSMKRSDTIYLTALDQEQVAGYCGIWCVLEEAEITNVSVRAGKQGRGIGRLLLEAAFTEADAKGILMYYLEVRKSNLKAIKLYQSLGFTDIGVRPDFYEKPPEDALLMRRCKTGY